MSKFKKNTTKTVSNTSNLNILLQQKKYSEAISILKKNLLFSLNKLNDYKTIGMCYYHLNDHKNCIEFLLKADRTDLDVLVALSQSYYYIHDIENMKKFGYQAIVSKMEFHSKNIPPSSFTPPSILSNDPTKNIISFSVFGGNSRYCETAILNIREAKKVYPAWTCRFYIDDTVPENIVSRIEHEGAQVIKVDSNITEKMNGLFWRFLVLDDPHVERFLIRDADSLVSHREASAVAEWIKSNQCFHIMRDGFAHTELILAGMWGGCTGIIKNMEALITDFNHCYKHHVKREYDQHFLRQCIWPFIQQSYMHHDSTFDIPQSQPFPAHDLLYSYEKNPNFHVGWDINSNVKLPCPLPNGQDYTWKVLDENQNIICEYTNKVANNQFHMIVPIPYLDQLNAKTWSIKIE